jgi:hypothetical protein
MNLIDQYNIQLNDYIYVKEDFTHGQYIFYAHQSYRIGGTDRTKRREKILICDDINYVNVWILMKYCNLIKYKRAKDIKELLQ